jgi:class 3 adenylate cyclase
LNARTFAFTDIRRAIAEHGGKVFKTIGDAFCSAFERPENRGEGARPRSSGIEATLQEPQHPQTIATREALDDLR